MILLALLLAAGPVNAASLTPSGVEGLDQQWLAAAEQFDHPYGRTRSVSSLSLPVSADPTHGRVSLSELAAMVSKDPKAMDDLVKALTTKLGAGNQAWMTEARKMQLEQALRAADKSKLDHFPILTPVELLQAAQYLAGKQKPAEEDKVPAQQTLLLKGKPMNPAKDAFLQDWGHGFKHGDESLMDQGSSHGDNEEVAQVLNRLALNRVDAPAYTLTYDEKKYTSVREFLQALVKNGDRIDIRDMRYFAQFGGLWYEHEGKRDEVMTPVYIDTGVKLPSGRALIVPVVHSHIEISIRGQVNADLTFYFGMDGAPSFRARSTSNKPWVGGRVVSRTAGSKAVEMLARAGVLRREMVRLGAETKLPLGGYGPLGDCNDVHAFLTGKAPYPMLRNPKYYANGGMLGGLSNSLPYDIVAKPDGERILDSMPYEDINQIPFPEVRAALLELQKE